MTDEPISVLTAGTVSAIIDTHDEQNRPVVLVVIDTPAGPLLVVIVHSAGRTAARQWNTGDGITAWGTIDDWTDPTDSESGTSRPSARRIACVRATAVQRHKPGQRLTYLLPPTQRPKRTR